MNLLSPLSWLVWPTAASVVQGCHRVMVDSTLASSWRLGFSAYHREAQSYQLQIQVFYWGGGGERRERKGSCLILRPSEHTGKHSRLWFYNKKNKRTRLGPPSPPKQTLAEVKKKLKARLRTKYFKAKHSSQVKIQAILYKVEDDKNPYNFILSLQEKKKLFHTIYFQ